MQAINIFAYVTRVAARFANPILVCCNDATVLTVCQEVIRDVYQQEGLQDLTMSTPSVSSATGSLHSPVASPD